MLRAEELERLLAACAGTSFEDRRDTAIIRLLASTGMRRGECVGLRAEDVDFDHEVALVLGKGRRPRACPFDRQIAAPWTDTSASASCTSTPSHCGCGWATRAA